MTETNAIILKRSIGDTTLIKAIDILILNFKNVNF